MRLHRFRTCCGKSGWYRWWWLVESLAHFQLRLINLLQALNPLVFRDLLQIFWTAIDARARNTNVCLFKRSNIVCTVTGHERDVSLRLEGHKGGLLLRRQSAGVDSGVLHECLPGWFPFELFHSCSSHADVVLGKQTLTTGWEVSTVILNISFTILHSRSRGTESACAESRHNTPIYQLHT